MCPTSPCVLEVHVSKSRFYAELGLDAKISLFYVTLRINPLRLMELPTCSRQEFCAKISVISLHLEPVLLSISFII